MGAKLENGALRDMAWVGVRTLTEQPAMDTVIDTLADLVGRPTFPPNELERQRQAMQVSLRKSEQSPGSVASKAFYREVFGEHPYAIDSGGTEASLKALNRDDLLSAYRRYYVARNATVAIVGALDRGQAEEIARRVTGKLAAGEPAPVLPEVQALGTALDQRVEFPSSQSHIYVGQPGMKRNDPDYFALYVGNHILGGSGLVSQLSEEVREKRGLSYSVSSYFIPMRERGPFLMRAQTKNASFDEALQAMKDTLDRFMAQGPSEEELVAAKRNITGGFPLRIASNSKILEYLGVIGFYDLPLDYLDRFNERVNAVTAEQIRDAFLRRVDPQRFVTIVVGGKPEQIAADS